MIKQIVFCFLLCFWIEVAVAETLSTNDLNTVGQDNESEQQKLQQLVLQKNSLNDLLAEIEKRYGETAAVLKNLHREIERERLDLNKIHLDIDVLKSEIKKQNYELAGQIRSAYAMGQNEKLKLILNQQDPGLTNRMMNYYRYFNSARIAKLDQVNRSVKRLDQLEKDKQRETASLEKKLAQKKLEQAALDGVRKQRHELLAQINDEFSSSAEQLTHLLESEKKLKSLIATLQNSEDSIVAEPALSGSSEDLEKDEAAAELATAVQGAGDDLPKLKVDFSSLKGKLPWPVNGRLVQKFGSPRSDSVWDGVLIDAKEGADIRAVNSGKVVYAEWLRGYGLLLIIDHGQGYMTLYAFNQSLYKRNGETVNAGDIIASVGQSGGRSQSGLYFGIRKKGTPIDPLEWCRK
jgi:murein hydrolase activator